MNKKPANTTAKELKFKEWFINSTHNTDEQGYKYTVESEWFTVRYVGENKVKRFIPNGKSFKLRGL